MNDGSQQSRVNAWLGSVFLIMGAILSCLVFVDRWTEIGIRFPGIWYTSRGFHLVICLMLFGIGAWSLHKARAVDADSAAVFQSVTLYSKPDCELCDRALDVLHEFRASLPDIDVVDISADDELRQQHAESVPVVEMDGVIRFRGIVSRELLARLIDARQRKADGRTEDTDS